MELIKEIKKVKLSTIFKNRAKQSIISQIINLKDDDDESICTSYTYEIMNNKTKEKKIETLFLILIKNMVDNLQNDNIQQYFNTRAKRNWENNSITYLLQYGINS